MIYCASMGNDVSRPASRGLKGSAQANALPPTPEPTPVKEFRPSTSTPSMNLPTAYEPLTPPPSGDSKQPEASELTRPRPASPPTSPDPRSPTLSPTLLGTPTPGSSFSFSQSTHSPPSTPCSHCHRRISRLQQSPQRRKPQPRSPPAQCGHALCHRCLRTALLTSLSRDPFTPARCPTRTSPPNTPNRSPNSNSNSNSTSPCATPLPLPTLGAVATAPEFLAYRHKLREMHTPPERRLYCHDREGCGMFLGMGVGVPEVGCRGGGGAVGVEKMEGVEGVEGMEGTESQGTESQGMESQGTESQGTESQGTESQGMESQGQEKGKGVGRGRVAALVCPLCGGRTCSGCGGRAHRFGGEVTGSPKDKMGRRRRRSSGLRTNKRKEKQVGGG
ncbi:uncharacterized protein B0H64DRAFT_386714 [Chaetomium fimeti]|uniref:RING-type domain-containing protein n=1 Tax=Chaetomium fimeti TaxID=1854472 RepID=A0AAE0LW78_9PEZI|nr:hypothetical protein B0H64DRAFT_386714 [Chaetomium fimeti]